MAKMYTLDSKLLTGTPEIRVGDKVYPVDDRQKTVKKILDICDKNAEKKDLDMIDEVFKLAFAPKDYKEIEAMNMPWAAYQQLFTLVISAVTGEDAEKTEARFPQENARVSLKKAGTILTMTESLSYNPLQSSTISCPQSRKICITAIGTGSLQGLCTIRRWVRSFVSGARTTRTS